MGHRRIALGLRQRKGPKFFQELALKRDIVVEEDELYEAQKTNPKALLDMLKDPEMAGLLVKNSVSYYLAVAEKALERHGLEAARLILDNKELAMAPGPRSTPVASYVFEQLIKENPLLIFEYPDFWDKEGEDFRHRPVSKGRVAGRSILEFLLNESADVGLGIVKTHEAWEVPIGKMPALLKAAALYKEVLWEIRDRTDILDEMFWEGRRFREHLVFLTKSSVGEEAPRGEPDDEATRASAVADWLRRGGLMQGLVIPMTTGKQLEKETGKKERGGTIKERMKYIALPEAELFGRERGFLAKQSGLGREETLQELLDRYKRARCQKGDEGILGLGRAKTIDEALGHMRDLIEADQEVSKIWPAIIKKMKAGLAVSLEESGAAVARDEVSVTDLKVGLSEAPERLAELRGIKEVLAIKAASRTQIEKIEIKKLGAADRQVGPAGVKRLGRK